MGELELSVLGNDLDVKPAGLLFNEHKQVGHTVPSVLVVISLALPGLGRQHLARLIEVDLRAFGRIRLGLQIEHVFHRRDEISADRCYAPLLFQPRLEFIFLSTLRTDSWE